jgi:hypothetical protein
VAWGGATRSSWRGAALDPLEFVDELGGLPQPIVEQVMGGNLIELLSLETAGR